MKPACGSNLPFGNEKNKYAINHAPAAPKTKTRKELSAFDTAQVLTYPKIAKVSSRTDAALRYKTAHGHRLTLRGVQAIRKICSIAAPSATIKTRLRIDGFLQLGRHDLKSDPKS
jgi:hypothetical protein